MRAKVPDASWQARLLLTQAAALSLLLTHSIVTVSTLLEQELYQRSCLRGSRAGAGSWYDA